MRLAPRGLLLPNRQLARLGPLISAPLSVSLSQIFNGASGFYFDFKTGASGAGISSIASTSPGTGAATQGTGSQQPIWTVDAPADYALFDGVNDFLATTHAPAAAATLAIVMRASASCIMIGSNDALTTDYELLAVRTDGLVGANCGSDLNSTIYDSGGSSVLNTDFIALIRNDGSTVNLRVNGRNAYTAAQHGVTNNGKPIYIGARNNNGAAGNFMAGRVYAAAGIDRYVPDNQISALEHTMAQGVPISGFNA